MNKQLNPSFQTQLNHDALQLSDVTKAIERIKRAIANDRENPSLW